jgi:hypothetical protein
MLQRKLTPPLQRSTLGVKDFEQLRFNDRRVNSSPKTSEFFSDDVESVIANVIRINFIEPSRSLTRTTLSPVILALVHDFIAEKVLDDSFLNFKCSRHFLSRFLSRVELSFLKARTARKPVIRDEACVHFLTQLYAAYHRYPPHLTLNFDESNWPIVISREQTVAERDTESVHQYLDGDPKADFSFFATMTADTQKLPLILIAKDKTDRCHKRFGRHDDHEFCVEHSLSGWSTKPL